MLRAKTYQAENITLVKKMIMAVNLALSVSREAPFKEALNYEHMVQTLNKTNEEANRLVDFHMVALSCYQTVIELLEQSPINVTHPDLIRREYSMGLQIVRKFKNQMNDTKQQVDKMVLVADALARFDDVHVDEADARLAYNQETRHFREYEPKASAQSFYDSIELLIQDSDYIYQCIEGALLEGCWIKADVGFLGDVESEPLDIENRKKLVYENIASLKLNNQELLLDAQKCFSGQSSRLWNKHQPSIEELTLLKAQVLENRDQLQAILNSLSFKDEESMVTDSSVVANNILKRTQIAKDLSFIGYLSANNKMLNVEPLFENATKLFVSVKKKYVQHAINLRDKMVTANAHLKKDLSLIEVKDIIRKSRQDKNALELSIRDDIELISLIFNQAQFALHEAGQAERDMRDISSRLHFLSDQCEKIYASVSGEGNTSSSDAPLQKALQKELFFEKMSDKRQNFLEDIHDGIAQMIKKLSDILPGQNHDDVLERFEHEYQMLTEKLGTQPSRKDEFVKTAYLIHSSKWILDNFLKNLVRLISCKR